MRLRCVCALIALCSVLLPSGCYWERCCCRHHERACGCGCEASYYTPCGCEAGSAYAPPLAPPLAPPASAGPVIPMPTPLMPNGSR